MMQDTIEAGHVIHRQLHIMIAYSGHTKQCVCQQQASLVVRIQLKCLQKDTDYIPDLYTINQNNVTFCMQLAFLTNEIHCQMYFTENK